MSWLWDPFWRGLLNWSLLWIFIGPILCAIVWLAWTIDAWTWRRWPQPRHQIARRIGF